MPAKRYIVGAGIIYLETDNIYFTLIPAAHIFKQAVFFIILNREKVAVKPVNGECKAFDKVVRRIIFNSRLFVLVAYLYNYYAARIFGQPLAEGINILNSFLQSKIID